MRLSNTIDYFLVDETISSNEVIRKLFITSDFRDYSNSTGKNRVSPCFRVHDEILINEDFKFTESNYFLFIGPLPINKIPNNFLKDIYLWLGYGMFNVIISTPSFDKVNELKSFLRLSNFRFECWLLRSNTISSVDYFQPELCQFEILSQNILTYFSSDKKLFLVVRGYYSLVKNACEKLRFIDDATYKKILLFHHSVEKYLLFVFDDVDSDKVQCFNGLTSINACLTRFNSQLLSCTSPILERECQVCAHSLFGIGMASLGLNNIGDYFYYKVGDQNIDLRFEKLLNKKYTEDVFLTHLSSKDPFWKKDHLSLIPSEQVAFEGEKKMPLLIYFSSRDGFRKTHYIISVPLISLYACNMPGWSLKTISHEASHLFVDTLIDYLFQNFRKKEWADKLCELCIPNAPISLIDTYEKAILHLFVQGLIGIESAENGHDKFDGEIIWKLYDSRHAEIQEIVTHAFDFLYFYHSDLKSYIGEIWSTWNELPHMATSIPDYIMRSLCIIVMYHFESPGIEDNAIGIFRELLGKIEAEKKHSFIKGNLDKVYSYIDPKNGNCDSITTRLVQRKFLLKFVRAFLFSDQIKSIIDSERYPIGISKKRELKRLEIPIIPFTNPLHITELSARSDSLSEAESYLIFYNLSFNYERE